MKYNKIMFMLVLAIFIFGAASVCASDVSGTVISSEDTGQMELSAGNENEIVERASNEEVIGEGNVGTFQELQENITQGYASGHITLDKDYEYEDEFSTDGITITQGITIDGQGHKIDAKGKARIFNIETDNVILKNITFLNGKSTDGGAINWKANYGSVLDCRFENNTAEYGGSVYFNGTGEVTNCNFTDNTASGKGGAVYVDKTFSNSKITSLFINNSANNGGAIYFNGGIKNVTINGYFKGNGAERAGGAIFVRGQSRNSTFSSEFYDNRARQASGGGIFFGNLVENNRFESIFKSNFAFYGGGIFLYNKANSNEFSSDFINNTAKSCGGAIFFYNTTDKNNFSGSFINNSALGEVSEIVGNGGAITFKDISSNCMFTCDFINNTAALNGGGINYRQTPHNITLNANFINNTSPRGGGVNFFESFENVIFNGEFICNCANNGGAIAAGEGIIKDVSFSNNHAKTGGAVYFAESGEIINCSFAGNSAELGGSLFMDSGSVINCNFTNNTATKNGGAIFVVNNTNILNSVFDNNNANSSGGAVYIYKAFSNSKINSTFINNSANNGGAIYFNGEIKNTTVNGCFNANIAERAGGAIFIRGQSRNSTFSSEFYDNRARQASGGAIFFYNLAENNRFESIFKSNFAFYGGGIFLYNKANSNEFISDFINNTAKSCGGAMFFHNTTDGNNFTGDFTGNSALGQVDESVGNGGAITFKDTSSNSIFNSDFINNTANLNGGGVNYRHTPYNITFNSNFINNTSPRGGGVNFFETFENVIFNGDFIGNSAVKGGAIAAVDGIIEGVSFTDNLAEKGGAVYINGTGEVINCIFTNNTATSDYDGGGAVYIGSGDVTGSVFTSNGATSLGGTGGAIFIKNSGDVTDCSFEDNFAEFGGAVATEINGNVNNCDFTANKASVEGGALYIGSGNVKNSNFTNNKASNGDGGAVYINGNVTVINCNFTGNEADMGSAIYYWVVGDSKYLRSISHSTFLNNKANMDPTTPFTFTINETNIEIAFEGNDNLLNAILSRRNADVNITNVTYWGANGVENTGDSTIVPVMSYMEAGQNVTIIGVVNGMPVNARGVTNVEGKVVLDAGSGDYWLSVGHDDDSYYSSAKTVFTNIALNANVTSQTTTNKTVNITAKSNIYSEVMPGKLIFILPNNTEINANYGTNGTWWAEHTFDAYGVYKVNASYIGLDNVAVSNGTVTIVRADSAIILDDIVLNYGESINVTVTTEGATGITAKIDENDVDVVNNFTISVSGLGVGNYTLTVTTIADEDHNSVNKTVKITVNKAPANITITNETLDLKVGYNSSISATLTPADAGNVTFTSSNSSVVTVDDKGNVKAVGVGSAIITVSFAGNDNYTAAENKTVEVTVAEYMVVSAPDLTKYYNGPERFVVIVTDSKGNPWVNQSVNITINGVTYSRTTNDNGTASMAIRLVGGQYNVTTVVGDITVYSTVTVLPTVNATDLVKVFRNGTQFYATFKDSNGDYLPEGTMVRFNINGVFYDRQVSGDKGLVKLNINIQQGQYVITSMNLVTGENASNNVTVISRLVENNDLVKYYRNDSQYTVKVIGDDGNAVGAGEIVTFNVHGVLYNRTTNESGIAKLNINLGPGDYIITAKHKDCRVSNNITVLPVLTAKDLTKKYGTPDQFIANLVDGQGNPFAGETVQFNVNGVLYDRVTDSNGQAKLNIRLMPGKYIITSSYNGASISNNITVSA